jgi:hypothetical protein
VIDKWWNGDLEVSSHGLIEVLSRKFTKGTASSNKNLNHDVQCHNLSAESYRVIHGDTIGILNGNVWGREKANSGEVKLPPHFIKQHDVRPYERTEVYCTERAQICMVAANVLPIELLMLEMDVALAWPLNLDSHNG